MKSNFLLKSLLEAIGTLRYNQLHTGKCFIHIARLEEKIERKRGKKKAYTG